MTVEFVIPLDKDELLKHTPGQYNVESVISVRNVLQALDETKSGLSKKGAGFILDHFDTFFSIIIHGNKVEYPIILRAFDRLQKALDLHITKLEQENDLIQMDQEEKDEQRCIAKMLAYLLSNIICYINKHICCHDEFDINNVGKRKKAPKKTDAEEEWQIRRQKIFVLLYRWIQLPLQNLWQPPIVEDTFITVITEACYKVLETLKEAQLKQTRESVFEILGTFIKKYNYGITCVIHIMQLVKTYEALASSMGHGIVYMVTKCGCKGLIEKVVQEIGNTDIGESEARNVATFLEAISTMDSTLLLPVLDDLLDHLSDENYTIRICIIEILGMIVKTSLTGEDLSPEQKEQRDMCLDYLFQHMLDINAFVRSKVLNVWQRLSCEAAVPLAQQGRLLKSTAARLEDKSANVRKQALQLLRALLQGNPFAAKMNKNEIQKQLDKATENLIEVQAAIIGESGHGAEERYELWETQSAVIHKTIKEVLMDVENNDMGSSNTEVNDEIFEKIRHLLLKRKIKKAVILTKIVCECLLKLRGVTDIDMETEEQCLLGLLYKIFIDSENVKTVDINEQQKSETEMHLKDRTKKLQMDKIKTSKKLVNYLQNCLEFAQELEIAMPLAEKLLFSVMIGDAVESCTLLGTAYQFGVAGADQGLRKALFQVFYRDQSVCKNVATVYKEIYLPEEPNKTERQMALSNVKRLIDLVKELESGQMKALTQLIVLWRKEDDLNIEAIKVMWEIFAMKIPNTTPIDSRAALTLLTMVMQAEPSIIIGNLDVLLKVGFGSRAKTDLLLARDTCRAFLKIKQESTDIAQSPIRFPNDHEIFKELLTLLTEHFSILQENGYISFAIDAINAIYHLANRPEDLIKTLLLSVSKNDSEADTTLELPSIVLQRYLALIGHIAIRQMVHMDTSVYKEMKRRNALRDVKKSSMNKKKSAPGTNQTCDTSSTSAMHSIRNKEVNNTTADDMNISRSGEEALEGATADDADAEYIFDCLEKHIFSEKGLLSKFIPIVLEVCQNPEKFNDESVQAAGVLALSKMMTVSSIFCRQQLQLLVTILEKSPYPGIRSNIIIGLTDLMSRFPNQVEPWTSHIYGRLRDDDVGVRTTCVKMLSSLIMREMVRVKGQVAELALCIVDSNNDIRQHTKQFFKDLSQKGNSLYNVMPDILSCLTDPNLNLEEDKFQEVIKFILGLLQKEKHVDSIIEKVCFRFKLASTDSQLQNLSYCLSLLHFNVKSIRYLIETLPHLKDKIHHRTVSKTLFNIIEQTKKKPETKDVCTELEEKVNEMLQCSENAEALADTLAMPPPRGPVPVRRKRGARTKKRNSSDEDDSDDSDDDNASARNRRNRKKMNRKQLNSDSDEDSDEEPRKKGRNIAENKSSDSDSSSEQEENRRKKKIPRTNQRTVMDSDSSDEQMDEEQEVSHTNKFGNQRRGKPIETNVRKDQVIEQATPKSSIRNKQKLAESIKKTGISPVMKKSRLTRSSVSRNSSRRNLRN